MRNTAGDFDGFAESTAPALFNLAYLLTGHRQGAEDLTQEALLNIYRHWPRIAAADHPTAYAKRVLTNCLLSSRRKRRVHEVRGLDLHDVERPGQRADPTTRVDEREEMWDALHQLPTRQRAVLVLRYYEGLSDGEIAQVLGWRPASVRSTAARALASLRTAEQLFPSRAAERQLSQPVDVRTEPFKESP